MLTDDASLTLEDIVSENGQAHFKNLFKIFPSMSDHFDIQLKVNSPTCNS